MSSRRFDSPSRPAPIALGLNSLPAVRPSAIIVGAVFTNSVSMGILSPLFGDTYKRAKSASSKGEFIHSQQAENSVTAISSSLAGSLVQSYGVGALLCATGTATCKGAAYLGGLVFLASTGPTLLGQIFIEGRPLTLVAVTTAIRAVDTIGLSLALTWWGVEPTLKL